jgi:hypothetical protein
MKAGSGRDCLLDLAKNDWLGLEPVFVVCKGIGCLNEIDHHVQIRCNVQHEVGLEKGYSKGIAGNCWLGMELYL